MQVTEPVLAFTPLMAASILVYKEEKLAGVKALLKRLFDFERTKHKIWYVPTILLMPLVYLLSYVGVQLLGIWLPVQPKIPFLVIPLLLVLYFIGAAGEELGYSGYVTDPIQERFGALKAGLVIGSFWALWHVPALLQNHLSLEYIVWGLPATVGLRILIIWLYNNTGKSVFAVNLCHVTALVGSSYVATSAGTPIIVVAAVIVSFLWGSETLARYRYAGSRHYEHYPPIN
jgi:membrane protease YdiL (CAAX protease family)